MQIYDITIAPNNVQEVASQGRYIYYYNGSAGGADASITVKHDMSGTAIVLKPGQAFRLDDKERGGGRWLIGNYANTAPILGRIVVGNGRIDDNTVTGSVEVVDGGKNRTKAGQSFVSLTNLTGVASQYCFMGLYNPAGSGKVAVVSGISVSCTAAAIIYVAYGAGVLSGTNNPPTNKNIGNQVAGVAVGVSGTQGTGGGSQNLFAVAVQASQSFDIPIKEPIVLQPGNFVQVLNTISGAGLGANVQYYEEGL